MDTLRRVLERQESLSPKHIEQAPGARLLKEVTERGIETFREAAQPRMLDDRVAAPVHAARLQAPTQPAADRTPSELRMMPGQPQPDPTLVPPGMAGAIKTPHQQWVEQVWFPQNEATNKLLDDLARAAPGKNELGVTGDVQMLRDLTRDNDSGR